MLRHCGPPVCTGLQPSVDDDLPAPDPPPLAMARSRDRPPPVDPFEIPQALPGAEPSDRGVATGQLMKVFAAAICVQMN
jgi:hypothetical protein